jgi:hypothetical protein
MYINEGKALGDTEMQWYACRTRPSHEAKVAKELKAAGVDDLHLRYKQVAGEVRCFDPVDPVIADAARFVMFPAMGASDPIRWRSPSHGRTSSVTFLTRQCGQNCTPVHKERHVPPCLFGGREGLGICLVVALRGLQPTRRGEAPEEGRIGTG